MVRTIDGTAFAQVLRAGTLRVVRERDTLDRINVFPVPDADTGANLAATLRAASTRLGAGAPSRVDAAARLAADAALDGARGNSGVIVAQFLLGVADALADRPQVGVREFAAAAGRGSEAAWLALREPREGTILSVLRAWAHEFHEHDHLDDFGEAWGRALAAARRALADTPKQLAVLARSHVVDAGGQGFVYFLEGIADWLRVGGVVEWPLHDLPDDAPPPFAAAHADIDETYRYCAEALIAGDDLDRQAVMDATAAFGGSLVVAGGARRVRVHVHTNEPQRFLATAAALGSLEGSKVDDMILQQLAAATSPIAIVTDSTCELPESRAYQLGIVAVPLVLTVGGHTYRDGVDMTALEFDRAMRNLEDGEVPKSSQPSVADFRSTYERLLEHHEAVVSLHIAGALSGTVQAATVAARAVDLRRVRVVDSTKVSVGVGLLAQTVADAIAAGCDLDEVERLALAARRDIAVYGTVSTLEYAVRGGRVSARAARLLGAAHLYPIITFNAEGRAAKGGAALGYQRALRALVRRAVRFAHGAPQAAMVVHTDALAAGEEVAEALRRALDLDDVPLVRGGPVLTTHVGLGCVALAVQRRGIAVPASADHDV